MATGYFRIKLPQDEAVKRFAVYLECNNYKEKTPATKEQALGLATDVRGNFLGSAVFVYENDGWTIFEDMSGSYFTLPVKNWLKFAGEDKLLVVGYEGTNITAEFIVIENGKPIREYLYMGKRPEENVDRGNFDFEINEPGDVVNFMDEDDLAFSRRGTLYIF